MVYTVKVYTFRRANRIKLIKSGITFVFYLWLPHVFSSVAGAAAAAVGEQVSPQKYKARMWWFIKLETMYAFRHAWCYVFYTCIAFLTDKDTRKVLDRTWDYRAKWRLIGIKLDIDIGTLDAIDVNNKKVGDCLCEMIIYWLRNAKPPGPTLDVITTVLQSECVSSTTGNCYHILA